MKRSIHNLVSILVTGVFVVGCSSPASCGVTKTRLGSLRRNDMVVTDIDLSGVSSGMVSTGDVNRLIEAYDVGTIQQRYAGTASTGDVRRIVEAYDSGVIQARYAETVERSKAALALASHVNDTTIQQINSVVDGYVSSVNSLVPGITRNRSNIEALSYKCRYIGPYLWYTHADYVMLRGFRLVDAGVYVSSPFSGIGVCTRRYHGRNFDYACNSNVSFVVKAPARDGQFGVLGVTGGFMPARSLSKLDWEPELESIQYALSDGINSKGVVVHYTAIPLDVERSSPWRTKREGSVSVYAVVRYVLDRCATAKEAAEMLRDTVFVPDDLQVDVHFHVSDRSESYIVEDGVIAPPEIPSSVSGGFRVCSALFDGTGYVDWKSVEPYGTGLERYNYAVRKLLTASDFSGFEGMMRLLWYSFGYSYGVGWYTQYCGTGDPKLTVKDVMDNPDILVPKMRADLTRWAAELTVGSPEYRAGSTHYTAYTAIYDKNELSLRLYANQDSESLYVFSLADNTYASALPEDKDALVAHSGFRSAVEDITLSGVKDKVFPVSRANPDAMYNTLTNLIIRLGGKVVEE